MPNPAPEQTGPQPTAAARTYPAGMSDNEADALQRAYRTGRTYTLHTNVDRTIQLTTQPNGTIQVAFRDHPSAVWGPPITLDPTA